MWEYRLIWEDEGPPWWDAAWDEMRAALQRHGRVPEERPDTYLVLPDRPDVGVKLRGGDDGGFEVKVRHASRDGWELWEKIPFFRWNDLEAARFAVALGWQKPPGEVRDERPLDGAKRLISAAGSSSREVVVAKRRAQTWAGDIMSAIPIDGLRPSWLAELVEFRAGDASPVKSICFESVNAPDAPRQQARGAPRAQGYPEFLSRVR